MQKGSLYSTTAPAFIVRRLFDKGHLTNVRLYFLVVLICVFIRFHDVKAVHVIFFKKNSVSKTDLSKLASGPSALL